MKAAEYQSQEHWLYSFIDEYSIKSSDDFHRAMHFPGPIKRLEELAQAAATDRLCMPTMPEGAILAGRGIDMSGEVGCFGYECVRHDVDLSYARILTYFDYVVAEGVAPASFLSELEGIAKKDVGRLFYRVGEAIKMLLYFRNEGIDKHVLFQSKGLALCEKHSKELRESPKPAPYLPRDVVDKAISRLAAEAKVAARWSNGAWYFDVEHEFFSDPARMSMKGKKSKRPSREEVAKSIVDYYSFLMQSDVSTASRLRLPLAQAFRASWMGGKSKPVDHSSLVALNLRLPVPESVSLGDLVKLRNDERECFQVFRSALSSAITEQIGRRESAAPDEIAKAVTREYIEPAIADIDRRLRINQKLLARKSGTSIAVGTAVASAGVMSSMPLVLATGVAAGATVLTHIYKYFDERGAVETSDMYFLWKVARLGKHR
ncbi:hypothetical protein ACBR40_39135 [Nonomuraea sp. AD125B]|uniref:hypothetical protein n=1 Tax=Nonomuraea sp. AD125B TaxID=3242897 RepID=UPI003527E6E9